MSPALVAAKLTQHHLVTNYFDTPDKVLERTGLTLRVRRSGKTHIQTVKSEANGHGVATNRGEWEWPINQDERYVMACWSGMRAILWRIRTPDRTQS